MEMQFNLAERALLLLRVKYEQQQVFCWESKWQKPGTRDL